MPRRLKPGDCIGVISPAGPLDASELLMGLNLLESEGFQIRMAPHALNRKEYLAGNDQERLDDLHAMFLDPRISAVFCARGGYGSLRLLDSLRFEDIRANPKILVGYSDITALLLALYRKAGLITFHGPTVRELGKDDGKNWRALARVLTLSEPYDLDLSGCRVHSPGRVSGVLVGGNLATICHLVGTPFLPSFEGALLVLEEVGEPPYRIDRMLTHLALSGSLGGLSGVIAGGFERCGEAEEIRRLLQERLEPLSVPLITDAPFGHGLRNLSFPVGVRGELDTAELTLRVPGGCVAPGPGEGARQG